MNKHKLILLGDSHGELRVSAAVLHEMVGALLEGARQATRFIVEGESTRSGPRPAWLDAACEIDITNLSAGSAIMEIEAPSLEEADPARFGDDGQGSLFDEPGRQIAKNTAVELFGGVLRAVVQGPTDEVMADRVLLETCVKFARGVGDRFEGVRLEGLRGCEEPVIVTPQDIPRIELLRDETPGPQAVRVCGALDTISASRADVILTLSDGHKVPARLEEHDAATLKELFGKQVVVSGVARYRPSGQLLLVDVESLAEAREGDQIFGAAPSARGRGVVAPMVAQDDSSGVSAFFGTWPGDESDEELLEALQAIG